MATVRRGRKSKDDKFESQLERDFAAKFNLAYEADRIKYVQTRHYTPDFKVGEGKYVELKGVMNSADRTKHKLVREQNPNLKILLVFQNPALTLNKTSKMTYGEWATRQHYAWCPAEDTDFITRWIAEDSQ